jgi:decaprenylphospho-beta-D-erythro-pentofuranosid-2-ulose 2-reductase
VGTDVRAVLLLGGSSDIGQAILDRLLPAGGAHVVLVGRASTRRAQCAARLSRTHSVTALDWSATDGSDPNELMRRAAQACGRPLDLVVVAVGTLAGQTPLVGSVHGVEVAARVHQVNFQAPAGVVLAAVQHLTGGGGRVVVLSSASAVRPRVSLATYSVAKQALDSLSRLADREAPRGVRVHVVRPGHVRTCLTLGLPEPPLTQRPDQVADNVARGIAADHQVIWSPRAMRVVMGALRVTPRRLLPSSMR